MIGSDLLEPQRLVFGDANDVRVYRCANDVRHVHHIESNDVRHVHHITRYLAFFAAECTNADALYTHSPSLDFLASFAMMLLASL